MKQEVRLVATNETNQLSLRDVVVKTLDREHPRGEDEPVTKTLGLGISNNPQEGSLVISLENKAGEVFFNIFIKNGRMSFKRLAKRPKNKPPELEDLCDTDAGLEWASESEQKECLGLIPVKIAVGEFRLEV